MMGARYGTVHSVGRKLVLVTLDKLVTHKSVLPRDLLFINE